MRVVVLGCGGSGGVPLVGGEWGACNPANPRNRRRRVSVYVEADDTAILIDASPDLRMQLLGRYALCVFEPGEQQFHGVPVGGHGPW